MYGAKDLKKTIDRQKVTCFFESERPVEVTGLIGIILPDTGIIQEKFSTTVH